MCYYEATAAVTLNTWTCVEHLFYWNKSTFFTNSNKLQQLRASLKRTPVLHQRRCPLTVSTWTMWATASVDSWYESEDDSEEIVQAPLASSERARQQVIGCLSEPVVNTPGVSNTHLPAPAETLVPGGRCLALQRQTAEKKYLEVFHCPDKCVLG